MDSLSKDDVWSHVLEWLKENAPMVKIDEADAYSVKSGCVTIWITEFGYTVIIRIRSEHDTRLGPRVETKLDVVLKNVNFENIDRFLLEQITNLMGFVAYSTNLSHNVADYLLWRLKMKYPKVTFDIDFTPPPQINSTPGHVTFTVYMQPDGSITVEWDNGPDKRKIRFDRQRHINATLTGLSRQGGQLLDAHIADLSDLFPTPDYMENMSPFAAEANLSALRLRLDRLPGF